VDDPLVVGKAQAAGDLDRVAECPGTRQRPALEQLAKRIPLEQLGDQVAGLTVMPELVNRQDVGVVERGDGAGLALEALQPLGLTGQRLGEDLDRHLATQPRVESAVDLTHPAGAERRHDLIGPEPIPWLQRHLDAPGQRRAFATRSQLLDTGAATARGGPTPAPPGARHRPR